MENLFTPMPKNSAVDYVIDQLKHQLMANLIKPGDKLPSEAELCANLGVSRGSLRSAMKVFETLGVVDIRPGDGTYVCTSISSKNLNPLIFSLLILRPGFKDVVQFREKMELDILELIIRDEQLTQAILPKLEENLRHLDHLRQEKASVEQFFDSEKDFHRILADGCGNLIFRSVYCFIFEFFSMDVLHSHMRQEYGSTAFRDHTQIYEAIKSRDFSMAKLAIKDSALSWVNLLESGDDGAAPLSRPARSRTPLKHQNAPLL